MSFRDYYINENNVEGIMGPWQFGKTFIKELEELGIPMSPEIMNKYNFNSVKPMGFLGKRPKTPQHKIWVVGLASSKNKKEFIADYNKLQKERIFEIFDYPYGDSQNRMLQIRLKKR